MLLNLSNNFRRMYHWHLRSHLHFWVWEKWILSEMRHVIWVGQVLRQKIGFCNIGSLLKSKLLFHLLLVTILDELVLILEWVLNWCLIPHLLILNLIAFLTVRHSKIILRMIKWKLLMDIMGSIDCVLSLSLAYVQILKLIWNLIEIWRLISKILVSLELCCVFHLNLFELIKLKLLIF